MRLLGVSGSLRRASHNRQLLRAAAELLPPGVEFVEFDGLKAIPPFDEDDEASPGAAVEAWRAAIERADAILFATPEYNSSIPGQLKNAIDWASRPFGGPAIRNKPVAVIGASTGMFGAVWSQAELRKALASAGARVVDRELPVATAHEAFDERDHLNDPDLSLELRGILAELLDSAERRLAPLGGPDQQPARPHRRADERRSVRARPGAGAPGAPRGGPGRVAAGLRDGSS